jgi:aminoglycoside phosphotransferase (APT) family kinase protein
MAELHSYVGPEFGAPEPGTGFSQWSELVRWDVTGLLTDAHRYELPLEPFTALCELVDRSTRELDEIDTPRLIHSDLGTRHVLVRPGDDGEPVIAGLIDLEFARFADPYSETLFVSQALEEEPDPGFEQFLGAYGAGELVATAKVRSFIYQLCALAWETTDAIRRNQRSEAMEELEKMRVRLHEDKHNW